MVKIMSESSRQIQSQTIDDFGDQWEFDSSNDGYYGSVDLLQDMLGPLMKTAEFKGCNIADIGSGTGRIVKMLFDADAQYVTAVEPSNAVTAIEENLKSYGDRLTIIQDRGEEIPDDKDYDFVTVIGVIPFIPHPAPVMAAIYKALKPGGKVIVWMYSKEGISLYRSVLGFLRLFTTRLPHFLLSALCSLLNVFLGGYIFLCKFLPLPMKNYMVNTLSKVSWQKRKLTIYDQLNPSYVRFYTREETENLFKEAGFSDPQLYHRRGYSWTVMAQKSEKSE